MSRARTTNRRQVVRFGQAPPAQQDIQPSVHKQAIQIGLAADLSMEEFFIKIGMMICGMQCEQARFQFQIWQKAVRLSSTTNVMQFLQFLSSAFNIGVYVVTSSRSSNQAASSSGFSGVVQKQENLLIPFVSEPERERELYRYNHNALRPFDHDTIAVVPILADETRYLFRLVNVSGSIVFRPSSYIFWGQFLTPRILSGFDFKRTRISSGEVYSVMINDNGQVESVRRKIKSFVCSVTQMEYYNNDLQETTTRLVHMKNGVIDIVPANFLNDTLTASSNLISLEIKVRNGQSTKLLIVADANSQNEDEWVIFDYEADNQVEQGNQVLDEEDLSFDISELKEKIDNVELAAESIVTIEEGGNRKGQYQGRIAVEIQRRQDSDSESSSGDESGDDTVSSSKVKFPKLVGETLGQSIILPRVGGRLQEDDVVLVVTNKRIVLCQPENKTHIPELFCQFGSSLISNPRITKSGFVLFLEGPTQRLTIRHYALSS